MSNQKPPEIFFLLDVVILVTCLVVSLSIPFIIMLLVSLHILESSPIVYSCLILYIVAFFIFRQSYRKVISKHVQQ